MTDADIERANAVLGVDKPVVVRYLNWLGQIIQGNLGYSYSSGNPVTEEIFSRLPATLTLMGSSMLISILLGIALGKFGALHKGKLSDNGLTVMTFIGMSLPEVWLALLLLILFSGILGWLPSAGLTDVRLSNPSFFEWLGDKIRHLLLPVTVCSITQIAAWARYQRGAFLEVINQDYIRTARAKGLNRHTVEWRHMMRNALLPLITLLGGALASLFGGAVIIESIFGLPGIGRLLTTCISGRNYPMIMGLTMISSMLILIGTLIADILYTLVDPRIRYEKD